MDELLRDWVADGLFLFLEYGVSSSESSGTIKSSINFKTG